MLLPTVQFLPTRLQRAGKALRIALLLLPAIPAFSQSHPFLRFKMAFAGDIMGHSPQITAATIEKDKVFDYSPCFQFVAPILQSANLAVGNLEVTLPGKPPYTGYPTFRSPDALATALRDAGFDLLVTSNNHSNDAGLNGVLNTIKTVQALGLYQTGTFRDSLSRDTLYPLLVAQDGFRLAFLNYTYGTNGIPTTKPAIVNLIEEKTIHADIQKAKKMYPDFIIAVMHWGNEYQLDESQAQRELAKKMLEWGVDMVIGAHPHVVQPIKHIAYIDSLGKLREGSVAFSLGNFISNQRQPNTDIGLIVEATIEKNIIDNSTRLIQFQYIPVFRYIHTDEKGKIQYYALPVSAFETENATLPLKIPAATLQHLRQTATSLRKHLNRFNASENMISLEMLAPPAASEPAKPEKQP
ncbi:MAG: CapA family protein [Saprospiraceae bacterium]|jgi:poly-gamma-glutamate capsule biosynthesis protein CapA/YwtB (metallophosphatase superfamily)